MAQILNDQLNSISDTEFNDTTQSINGIFEA